MRRENKKRLPKKNLIAIACIGIVLCVALGTLLFEKLASAEKTDVSKLRKQLADSSISEVSLSGTVELTKPLEISGEKIFTGSGTIKAANNFKSEEVSALLIVMDKADVTIGGSVKVNAKKVDCGIYVAKDTSLTLEDDVVFKNAKKANIYSLGQVTQKGGTLEAGYDNVYIDSTGDFLWESGMNRASEHHGVHIEEEASLKVTSKKAAMREAGSHGICLKGEAILEDILLIMSTGNQIDVASTGKLTMNGGEIAYGNKNGIRNQGTVLVTGGKVYNSACTGIVNSGTVQMTGGSVLNNTDKGVCNKNGGKLTIASADVTIGSNGEGVVNEENALCELAYATFSSNSANSVVNYGEILVHDITLANSSAYAFNSSFGGHAVLRDVVIDGVGSQDAIINTNGATIELYNVLIKEVKKSGISNVNGTIIGKNITVDTARTGVYSVDNARLETGTMTLENVTTKNISANNIFMHESRAGIVNITKGEFGPTDANNLSIKNGEVNLVDVKIVAHTDKAGTSNHGVYLKNGTLNMKNCTVSDTHGAAIRIAGGKVVAENLKVSNITNHNVFASGGSALLKNSKLAASDYYHVYCKGGDVTVQNCELAEGVVSSVSVRPGGTVNINETVIGAAQGNNIIGTGGTININKSIVKGNISTDNATIHGVYAKAGKVNIKDSTICNTSGAAIRNSGATIVASNLTVDNIKNHNVSASDGGSTLIKDSHLAASDYYHVYCKGGEVTIQNCELAEGVVGSVSVPEGGTVNINETIVGATQGNNIIGTGGTINLNKSTVNGNMLPGNTTIHGVYAKAGKVNIKDSTISNTTGAAIRNAGATIVASNLTVDNIKNHNVSASDGGSTLIKDSHLAASDYYHVYCKGGEVTVQNCELEEGVVGSVSVPKGGTVNIDNTLIGATQGNNVIVTGGTVNLNNSIVAGHISKDNGSIHGIYATAGIVNVKNTKVSNTGGAAIRNAGASVKATGLTVKDVGGHNISVNKGTTVVENSTLSAPAINHVACWGGEVIVRKSVLSEGATHGVEATGTGKVTCADSIIGASQGNNLVVEDTATLVVEKSSLLGTIATDNTSLHGVYAKAGTVTIQNSTISHTGGAAIRNAGASVKAIGLTVKDIFGHNISTNKGTTVVENSTLSAPANNHVACWGGEVQLKNSVLEEGAIYAIELSQTGKATITDSTTNDIVKAVGKTSALSVEGKIIAKEIQVEDAENFVTIIGVLKDGSNVNFRPNGGSVVVAKSADEEQMTANMPSLKLVEEFGDDYLVLTQDKETAIMSVDTTPRYVANYAGTNYYSLQEAIDAAETALENVAEKKATITIISSMNLMETVTIPEEYEITLVDDGVRTRKIMRAGFDAAMFTLGSNSTLNFTSSSDSVDNIKLLIDGKNVNKNSSRLAIISSGTTVNVGAGVEIANHTCIYDGAAFYVERGGTLYISKAKFTNNMVTGGKYQGGAIYAETAGATPIIVSDSIFTGNTSTLGGAISFSNTSNTLGVAGLLQVTGCTFNENKVSGRNYSWGGAILIGNYVNCTLENNTFEGNTSSALGNDVCIGTNAVLNLRGSQTDSFEIGLTDPTGKIKVEDGFIPNTGTNIVLLSDDNRTVGDVMIECVDEQQAKSLQSSFELYGEKLQDYVLGISGSDLVLQSGGVKYNGQLYDSIQAAVDVIKTTANTSGTIEVINVNLSATVTIPEACNITITNEGGKLRTITRNNAWTEDKPMFELGAGSTLTFTSSSDSADNIKLLIDGKNVNKNSSRLVIIPSGTAVNVGAGVEMANHTCKYDGAVFCVKDGGTLHVSKAKFTKNIVSGAYKGGAIYAETEGAVTITVSDSIFTGNTSVMGGAISVSNKKADVSSSLQVTGCTFNENKASGKNWSHGGAILIGNYVNCTLENNTFEGNTAQARGNDVCMGTDAVLNLRGSQTDSFEIILMDKTGKIKVEDGFAPNTGTEITLISKVERTEGDILIECADNTQAKEMISYFIWEEKSLESSGNNLVVPNTGLRTLLALVRGLSL